MRRRTNESSWALRLMAAQARCALPALDHVPPHFPDSGAGPNHRITAPYDMALRIEPTVCRSRSQF